MNLQASLSRSFTTFSPFLTKRTRFLLWWCFPLKPGKSASYHVHRHDSSVLSFYSFYWRYLSMNFPLMSLLHIISFCFISKLHVTFPFPRFFCPDTSNNSLEYILKMMLVSLLSYQEIDISSIEFWDWDTL